MATATEENTGAVNADAKRPVQRRVMCDDDINEVMAGMDRAMAEMEKKVKPPVCHFTPMFFDEVETESWWECKHCGHTKLIDSFPAY